MRVQLASFCALGLVVVQALASPAALIRKETNAARFARGLPPLSPRAPPSKVEPAAWPKESAPPAKTYIGRIQIRHDLTNTVLGYVKNWESGSPTKSGINPKGYEDDLYVKFTVPYSRHATKPFDILATNPHFSAPWYIGAQGDYLQIGSHETASLWNVEKSSPGASIWTLDGDKLIPHYVNKDGSSPPTKIVYQKRENKLFFTSDIEAWQAANKDYEADEVTLHLADLP